MLTFFAFLPEFTLFFWAIGTLIRGVILEKKGLSFQPLHRSTLWSLCAGAMTLFLSYIYFVEYSSRFYGVYFQERMALDSFTLLGKFFLLIFGIFWCGFRFRFCVESLSREGLLVFETRVLFLLSLLGGCIVLSSIDLLCAYLGLTLQTLPLYGLIAFRNKEASSGEGAFKYFVMGTLGSLLFLYGVALLYGYSGTTSLPLLIDNMESGVRGSLSVPWLQGGLLLLVVGLFVKLGVAPFHLWVPDAYEGSASVQLPFIAIVSKISIFFFLGRLFLSPLKGVIDWHLIFSGIGILSMGVGAVLALRQDNLKRLFAYGSIGHMGLIFLGMSMTTQESFVASLAHLVVYGISFVGFFFIIVGLRRGDKDVETIQDLHGLWASSPLLALTMAILVLSAAGLPPFLGFWTKFHILMLLSQQGLYGLVGVILLCSLVALGYSLRILNAVFFEKALEPSLTSSSSNSIFLIILSSILTFAFIVQSAFFNGMARML